MQHTSLTPDEEMNSLIYGTLLYVNIYRSYKLKCMFNSSKMIIINIYRVGENWTVFSVQFLAHPVNINEDRLRRINMDFLPALQPVFSLQVSQMTNLVMKGSLEATEDAC